MSEGRRRGRWVACGGCSSDPPQRVADRLEQAFRAALDLPVDADVRGLRFGRHAHWDSVGHMALVSEIEETYDVMLDGDDVLEMSSFDKAAEIVEKLGAQP